MEGGDRFVGGEMGSESRIYEGAEEWDLKLCVFVSFPSLYFCFEWEYSVGSLRDS